MTALICQLSKLISNSQDKQSLCWLINAEIYISIS